MQMAKLFRRGRSCGDILEVLQSYLDGETSSDVARQVASHLGRCDRCERESAVYDKIRESLSRQRRDLDPTVMAALAQFGERLTRGEHH